MVAEWSFDVGGMESQESRDHSELLNIHDRENMQMTPKDLVQKGYDSFAHGSR